MKPRTEKRLKELMREFLKLDIEVMRKQTRMKEINEEIERMTNNATKN